MGKQVFLFLIYSCCNCFKLVMFVNFGIFLWWSQLCLGEGALPTLVFCFYWRYPDGWLPATSQKKTSRGAEVSFNCFWVSHFHRRIFQNQRHETWLFRDVTCGVGDRQAARPTQAGRLASVCCTGNGLSATGVILQANDVIEFVFLFSKVWHGVTAKIDTHSSWF